MKKLFTPEQDSLLRSVYETGVSVNRLAKEHECSGLGIRAALVRAGATIRREKLDAEAKRVVAKRYLAGEGSHQLAASFNVTHPTITKALKQSGIAIRDASHCHQKYPINEAAFDVVTEESAYWTGLLMADGCLFAPSLINLTLTADDRNHVLLFRSFLGAGHPLRETPAKPMINPRTGKSSLCRPLSTLALCNITLFRALTRFGLKPQKSLTASVVGLENNRHFWRGVIDGDGSLRVRHGRIRTRHPVVLNSGTSISLAGSRTLLGQFATFAKALLPTLNATVRPDGRFGTTSWQFAVTGVGAIKLVRELYADCRIALARKLVIAQAIIAAE